MSGILILFLNSYVYLDYTPLEELITIEGLTKEGEWIKIENLSITQTQAQNRADGNLHWFQTYISGTVEVGKFSSKGTKHTISVSKQ